MTIRLSYASQYLAQEQNLLEDLREILVIARQFNMTHNICGALYYAQGHFFQCLEGEAKHVQALYQSIYADPRHQVLKCFIARKIEQPQFTRWSMKYAQPNSAIQNFLFKQGIKNFEPQNLAEENLEEFIQLLLRADSLSLSINKKGTARGYQHYF